MNTHHPIRYGPLSRLLVAAGLAALSGPLLAATTTAGETQATYQRDVTACRSGKTGPELSSCMQEARAAYAEARKGVLGDGIDVDTSTAIKRCDALKENDEHVACIARMNGKGTTSGSVAGGGIYRELVTREPAPIAPVPTNSAPAAMAPSTVASPAAASSTPAAPRTAP